MGRPVRSTKGPVQFIAVTSSSSVMGYFTVAVVLLAFLPGGLACAPQPSGITVDRLMRMLDAAKARNGSGRMHLQGHGSGPTSAGYPIAEWPPGTEVVRAPEGGTLVIPFPYHITNNITLRSTECHKPKQKCVWECAKVYFLPGRLVNRFLWRSGGCLLIAESIPAVAARSWWGFYGWFEFGIDDAGRCSSTMKIDMVTWKNAYLHVF
ncbi:uncharacterized protein LOC129601264 isoform X2 [Paramacrobiotus metropolitanus]|uniref:uncharacterized protein LOC129601264 isoform X2 n=1 Tax=Paramacrobiotus metropolitanus TaxID=2943436 RepID=UPI0024462FB6|nr:uncharacterized protein LOC129601264 isoform X2 [Paramacrobiotus metropolitanus]